MSFGPFRPGLDHTERVAQLRSLQALARVYCGHGSLLVDELRNAEHDEAAATRALELLDRLPALTRRRLLATFGTTIRPRSQRASRKAEAR